MTVSESPQKFVRSLIIIAFSLYSALLIFSVARGIGMKYQWDFKSHYCAAQVHKLGLNFYDEPYLRHYCSPDASQYYSYTPLSIWFFRFFALFPYPRAYHVFLFLKVLALAGLFLLWIKVFLEEEADAGFLVFALIAFNGALYLDLRAGNISLFEQLGLWLGFFFLLKKKPVLFGLCVILAASFKVVPLVFLGILLIFGRRKYIISFAGSLLAFGLLHGLSYAAQPFLFKEFLRVFFTMLRETRGITNPSTFVWLQNVLDGISAAVSNKAPSGFLIYGTFSLLAAAILFMTWKALKRLKTEPGRNSEKAVIYLFCFTYALIIPRFKDYSFILLLVPAYFALRKYAAGLGRIFLFALAGLSVAENTSLPGFEVVFRHLWNFFPLLTAAVFWTLYLRQAHLMKNASFPSFRAT